jgi:3-hydroxybutyryl-CoA dehydrogenase
MRLAILANENQKAEWLSKPRQDSIELIWVSTQKEFLDTKADAYFDLLFQAGSGRVEDLASLKAPLFLNEVIHPIDSILPSTSLHFNCPIFRMNAWPTFLKRNIVEIGSRKKEDLEKANFIFSAIGWKFKSVPDIPGLISARVIAMIINEAYYTLQEDVSSKEEIDIAMKLGTNYPYGPFEWSQLIGLQNIYQLLVEMSRSDQKYEPCERLIKETEQQSAWH